MHTEVLMAISTGEAQAADRARVLGEATLNAARALGLTQGDLQEIVGRHPSNIRRHGLDPDTKAGELALLLIRLYRSLFALLGGEPATMRHWMHTDNRDIGGIPADRIQSIQGLAEVVAYLDALRGTP